MKKILLFIPWYGQLPNYFNTWLQSAMKLDGFIDFLLVGDFEKVSANKNGNILHYNISFADLKKRVAERGIKAPMHAYKLCDYKPLYGYIFEDFLTEEYEYWGYCDVDTILGDVRGFLEQIDFRRFDRIGEKGHFTIYRNNKMCRELFRTVIPNAQPGDKFEYVCKTTYACHFDEEGMNKICHHVGLKYYEKNHELQTCEAMHHIHTMKYKDVPQLLVYENGHTYSYAKSDDKIVKEEGMYIHFQYQKNMPALDVLGESFCLTPDGFHSLDMSKISDVMMQCGQPDSAEEAVRLRAQYVKKLRKGRYSKILREFRYNGFYAIISILNRIPRLLQTRKYGNL